MAEEYKSVHTGPDIDAAVTRALSGGPIDKALSEKIGLKNYYGDIDALIWDGHYRVQENQNLPNDLFYGQVIASRGLDSDTVAQIGIPYTESGFAMFRGGVITGGVVSWGSWRKIATATPPTEYDLPLADNVAVGVGPPVYWKNQFSEVGLNIVVKKSDSSAWVKGDLIGTLPTGFRPSNIKFLPCIGDSGTGGTSVRAAAVQIKEDGSIGFYGAESSVVWLEINVVFISAS